MRRAGSVTLGVQTSISDNPNPALDGQIHWTLPLRKRFKATLFH